MSKQPDPVSNDLPALWDLVIQDMQQRDSIGLKNYGTRLQPFNGRDSLQDLSEELLDGLVYLKQVQFELASVKKDLICLSNELDKENKEKLELAIQKLSKFS